MVVPQWDVGLGFAALNFASFKPLVGGDMMFHMFLFALSSGDTNEIRVFFLFLIHS